MEENSSDHFFSKENMESNEKQSPINQSKS